MPIICRVIYSIGMAHSFGFGRAWFPGKVPGLIGLVMCGVGARQGGVGELPGKATLFWQKGYKIQFFLTHKIDTEDCRTV